MIQTTSRDAYAAADTEGQRKKVLALFAMRDGWTADAAAAHYEVFHNSIAPAFTYLKRAGLIVDSGTRRETRSERTAIVWVLTDAGRKSIGVTLPPPRPIAEHEGLF